MTQLTYPRRPTSRSQRSMSTSSSETDSDIDSTAGTVATCPQGESGTPRRGGRNVPPVSPSRSSGHRSQRSSVSPSQRTSSSGGSCSRSVSPQPWRSKGHGNQRSSGTTRSVSSLQSNGRISQRSSSGLPRSVSSLRSPKRFQRSNCLPRSFSSLQSSRGPGPQRGDGSSCLQLVSPQSSNVPKQSRRSKGLLRSFSSLQSSNGPRSQRSTGLLRSFSLQSSDGPNPDGGPPDSRSVSPPHPSTTPRSYLGNHPHSSVSPTPKNRHKSQSGPSLSQSGKIPLSPPSPPPSSKSRPSRSHKPTDTQFCAVIPSCLRCSSGVAGYYQLPMSVQYEVKNSRINCRICGSELVGAADYARFSPAMRAPLFG